MQIYRPSKTVENLTPCVFQALDVATDKKRPTGETVDVEDGQKEATFFGFDDCLDETDSSANEFEAGDFFNTRYE